MASQNPLAVAIDRRIRVVVEEALGAGLERRVAAAARPLLEEAIARIEANLASTLVGVGLVSKRGPGRPKKVQSTPVAAKPAPRAVKPAAKPAPRAAKAAPASNKKPGRPKQAGPDGAPVPCSVAGCGKEYRSKGYCSAHYQAARKNRWPMPAPGPNWTPPSKKK